MAVSVFFLGYKFLQNNYNPPLRKMGIYKTFQKQLLVVQNVFQTFQVKEITLQDQ
jgi:hypothetical protein